MRTAATLRPGRVDDLVAGLISCPAGQISPSVYETARVTSLAPWLSGHDERVRWLLDRQGADGLWPGPGSYGWVPTLSAVEALLTVLRGPAPVDPGRMMLAVRRALAGLHGLDARVALPDTVAAELIVPALAGDIAAHLAARSDQLGPAPPAALAPAAEADAVRRLRDRVAGGAPVPAKLLHTLEIAGRHAHAAPSVRPVRGTVGGSPAATAAWLGPDAPGGERAAVSYLERLVARYGGPVPAVSPVTPFERAWVLRALLEAGITHPLLDGLRRDLAESFTERGVGGGTGLPPDADTTSAVVHVLGRAGIELVLEQFRLDGHFVCYPRERTPSPTANAHVLEAYGAAVARHPELRARHVGAMTAVTTWLREQQHRDGRWTDKWHASAYYATLHCARALHRYGVPRPAVAVSAAARWILDSQRANGSWGRWAGTAEETAYAVQLLAELKPAPAVLRRGRAYLTSDAAAPRPPLWHEKDLYTPDAIVTAEVLAALRVSGNREHLP
jgi:Squalene-hopene cyclase C-terminal domain